MSTRRSLPCSCPLHFPVLTDATLLPGLAADPHLLCTRFRTCCVGHRTRSKRTLRQPLRPRHRRLTMVAFSLSNRCAISGADVSDNAPRFAIVTAFTVGYGDKCVSSTWGSKQPAVLCFARNAISGIENAIPGLKCGMALPGKLVTIVWMTFGIYFCGMFTAGAIRLRVRHAMSGTDLASRTVQSHAMSGPATADSGTACC